MGSGIYYVYILFRPWDGTPFYVGKGKGHRIGVHEVIYKTYANKHLARVIAKAKAMGLSIPRVKVREGMDEEEAFRTEKSFIAAIGRRDLKAGPLANMTSGGEGSSNPSEGAREKRASAHRGLKRSKETCERISLALSGRTLSEEDRLKRSGWSHSKESRSKMSKAGRGKPKSLTHRAKISKAAKRRYSPEPLPTCSDI